MDSVYASKHTIPESIMQLLLFWAQARSKDPNTKVAAAVYDPVTGGLFLGYNGFPTGFSDQKAVWDHRPLHNGAPDTLDPYGKYARIIHAERNAVKKAVMALGEHIDRCEIYCTHYPCRVCMLDWIINFGIKKSFYLDLYPPDIVTPVLALEHGVLLEQVTLPEGLQRPEEP